MVFSSKFLIGIEVKDSELYTIKKEVDPSDPTKTIDVYYDLFGNKMPNQNPPIFGWDLKYGSSFDLYRVHSGDYICYLGYFTSQLYNSSDMAVLTLKEITDISNQLRTRLSQTIGFESKEIKAYSFLYVDNR